MFYRAHKESEKKPEKAKISKPKPKTRAVAKVKKDLPKLEKTKIYGILVNYRLGHSSQHNREFLIRIPNVNDNLIARIRTGYALEEGDNKADAAQSTVTELHIQNCGNKEDIMGWLKAISDDGTPVQIYAGTRRPVAIFRKPREAYVHYTVRFRVPGHADQRAVGRFRHRLQGGHLGAPGPRLADRRCRPRQRSNPGQFRPFSGHHRPGRRFPHPRRHHRENPA